MTLKKFSVQLVVILLTCALGVERLSAQVSGGTILGTVRDTSGASIPGANVGIRNNATGTVTTITANQSGLYRVPNLTPGTYQLTASATGCATTVEDNVTVDVGSELAVNLQLRVGAVIEKVQVTSEAPEVSTTNSTISAVVNENTVRE